MPSYEGLLLIGDPHAASKVIGFRKDDYPRTVLRKLSWCLQYASDNRLLPFCLGDLFHHPRDNMNWLLSELLLLLGGRDLHGIYGNHDCREGALSDDDSLSVLIAARAYRLLTMDTPWRGSVGGRKVAVYGTSWNQTIRGVERHPEDELVVLLTHHDIGFEEYDPGRNSPAQVEGVDVVVNGHIHRRLQECAVGSTRWLNPGNIIRVSRSDVLRSAVPSILVLRPDSDGCSTEWVTVPHEPFDEVFHPGVEDVSGEESSVFIRGLAELQQRRTQTGAGLREFLDANLGEFEPDVREEIESLAAEALGA